jgi:hypothetical protein
MLQHRHLQLGAVSCDPAGVFHTIDFVGDLVLHEFVFEIQQAAVEIHAEIALGQGAFHVAQQHEHAINGVDNLVGFAEPVNLIDTGQTVLVGDCDGELCLEDFEILLKRLQAQEVGSQN